LTVKHNIPEYSVTEFNDLVKELLHSKFGYIRIRGEISQINQGRIGQIFVTFKDENSILNGVIWKNKKLKISIEPEVGMEVIATGNITTYSKSISTYQIDIEDLEIAGEGALLKLIEERKKKLAAEGIFDTNYKKKIPFLPNRIGIITSPTGSVIYDILNRLKERFPINVDLWPTAVQGKEAAEMIINAIKGFNSDNYFEKPDVIIIARGGGSVEDLMIFNDENLARTIFLSKIPIVTGIGHETDTTIADLASDLRTPTPTAAAEKIVPVRKELIEKINLWHLRLNNSIKNQYNSSYDYLNNLLRLLKDPISIIYDYRNRFLLTNKNFIRSFKRLIENKQNSLKFYFLKLKSPEELYNFKKTHYSNLSKQISLQIKQRFKESLYQLDSISRLLFSNSIDNNLKKGFVLIKKNTSIVKRGNLLKKNDEIKIKFFDKELNSKIK